MQPPWNVKTYYWTNRVLSRFFDAVQTVHQGFWLGMLDQQVFSQVTQHGYLTWEKLYSDRDYNLSGLWPWETSTLDLFFASCRSILIAAAGGGREIIALTKRGFEVDGFDCSPQFLERCREFLTEEGIQAHLFLASPDAIPKNLTTYDGIIVGWGCYMHIAGRENRVRFLAALRAHIREGGPLLISFLTRAPNSRQARRISSIARKIRWLRRSRHNVELGDALLGSFNHMFTRAEVAHELERAGFKLEHYAQQPYGHAVGTACARLARLD